MVRSVRRPVQLEGSERSLGRTAQRGPQRGEGVLGPRAAAGFVRGARRRAHESAEDDLADKLLRRRRQIVVTLAFPLKSTELQGLIQQYREETRHRRDDVGLENDDGWVECVDWDGVVLEVPEAGILSAACRRMEGKRSPIRRRTEIAEFGEAKDCLREDCGLAG